MNKVNINVVLQLYLKKTFLYTTDIVKKDNVWLLEQSFLILKTSVSYYRNTKIL